LLLGEIVYVRVDYIGLLKGRLFIMIANHLVASNTILDFNTLCIAIFVNLTERVLKISKRIWIGTIYECIDTVYIFIDAVCVFAVLAIAFSTSIEPFSSV
jgi:hypothetical protein